jgi:hypothetical protein
LTRKIPLNIVVRRYASGATAVNSKDIFPNILVSRTSLTMVAKRLKRSTTLARLKSADMAIRLADGNVILEIPGASDGVPATGTWPGQLRVTAKVLVLFARGEPPGDEVQLTYDRGRLSITDGRAKINYSAEWETTRPPRIEVTLEASDADYLRIASQYPLSQVISSGLENAAFTADQKFQSAIDQAYQAMQPYGITRAELETVLRAMVLKRR